MTRVLILCLALAGCDYSQENAWDKAPLTHACTVEQMNVVQTQTEWCNKNTGYLSRYCYGTAIMRNCKKLGVPAP